MPLCSIWLTYQVSTCALHYAATDRVADGQVLVVLHVFTLLCEIVQMLLDFLPVRHYE